LYRISDGVQVNTQMSILEQFGWDARWALAAAEAGLATPAEPGRITAQHRDRWLVQRQGGTSPARIVTSSFPGSFPVTGDWVLVEPGPGQEDPVSIRVVLPRRSSISRGAAGSGATEQVLAANIDVVWIVQSLDIAPNLRRLERYLAVAWESGAIPEVVLTKADLAADGVGIAREVEAAAIGVRVHVVSVHQPKSVRALRNGLEAARTVVLLGPSGAGKSTLINALADEVLSETNAVREKDRKGRHTTTGRGLFQITGGALLLDTPGLRELRVWDVSEGLAQAFPDLRELAESCRFRDCRHEAEPGCAVRAAVESGTLAAERLASYQKLCAEAAHAERKVDPLARAAAVARHKTALKTLKYHPKYRND
jgi:ribosome biogenesis GTPase / thiamine phosphate phosphatase